MASGIGAVFAHLFAATFWGRPAGRLHSWSGGIAAGHGIRHRIRRHSTSRPIHRDHCGRIDLGAGRIPHADRRTNRRLRGHRGGNCREVRSGRSGARHHDGRRNAHRHGTHRPRFSGQIHSPPSDHRFHQWHRSADCIHPDQRLLGAENRRCAERFYSAHGCSH